MTANLRNHSWRMVGVFTIIHTVLVVFNLTVGPEEILFLVLGTSAVAGYLAVKPVPPVGGGSVMVPSARKGVMVAIASSVVAMVLGTVHGIIYEPSLAPDEQIGRSGQIIFGLTMLVLSGVMGGVGAWILKIRNRLQSTDQGQMKASDQHPDKGWSTGGPEFSLQSRHLDSRRADSLRVQSPPVVVKRGRDLEANSQGSSVGIAYDIRTIDTDQIEDGWRPSGGVDRSTSLVCDASLGLAKLVMPVWWFAFTMLFIPIVLLGRVWFVPTFPLAVVVENFFCSMSRVWLNHRWARPFIGIPVTLLVPVGRLLLGLCLTPLRDGETGVFLFPRGFDTVREWPLMSIKHDWPQEKERRAKEWAAYGSGESGWA